jgi:WD40 repeat protein
MRTKLCLHCICVPAVVQNFTLATSPDGRFVSVGAFTAEIKIWEVKFSREGAYYDTEMVMALKGHSSQVKCVGFSSDCTKAYTASLDGTLGIWNIDVRYQLKEDAKRILKVLVVHSTYFFLFLFLIILPSRFFLGSLIIIFPIFVQP